MAPPATKGGPLRCPCARGSTSRRHRRRPRPAGDGWFVLNVRDAAWVRHDVFGARCAFEADGRMAKERPELEVQHHPQVGFKLHILQPCKPSTMYHRESDQEGFLVLRGACLL